VLKLIIELTKAGGMKSYYLSILVFLYAFQAYAQTSVPVDSFQDRSHFSKVFNTQKHYRLYLPAGYQKSNVKYPVIYFFHGWGGRHFKDDNALLEYLKIKTLVDKYKLILVMWDGSMDGVEPRPYNVGNHEDVKYQVQMKDYFPELVNYIDSTYRTLSDRRHRGIIGFSMGGYMSLFLAGKYPHSIGSIVSLAGSPEFFVGYPENHTLYPVRYTFKNLEGVNVRIHNGDTDILTFLNDEVYKGALWEGFPLDYWKFKGGHMVDLPGETKVFEMAMKFIANSFEKNSIHPQSFTHYDVYNNFDVWGYKVESNKREPGFITLRNANKQGFGIGTQRWLPLGPFIEKVNIKVTTPPVYVPNSSYGVTTCSKSGSIKRFEVKSDASGAITLETDGMMYETGIYKATDPPYLTFLNYTTSGNRYLKTNQPEKLNITLFNRGNKLNGPVRVSIRTNDSSVVIADSTVYLKQAGGQAAIKLPAVNLICKKQPPLHADPSEIKFYIRITSGKYSWNDDFVVPVLFDVPYFENLKIDDSVIVKEKAFGQGNADGIANKNENIMVYEGLNRLRLYSDDKYLITQDERLADEVIPAIWPDGYTFSSVVHISPDCPAGHEIECVASYETKTHNPIERKVIWGKVTIRVK
jgi:enterochelin esterase-like enzyme